MTVRAVEGKKPYTGGKAIEITEDKVINLRLRDENNLIIRDEGDNEIYVDLQLDDEIRPTDAFPVGVTTGRVISDNGWDYTGTVMIWKTTSGDYVMLLYADDGKVYIDNGTGTLKQIYLKPEIDAILQDYVTIAYLQANYPTTEYVDSHDTQISATEPATPTEGMLWYDTTNNVLKTYDGTQWNTSGGGAIYTAGNGINIDVNDEISIDTSVVATQTDLSNKANKSDLNTKTFFLSSLNDTSTLQSIVNWMGGEYGTPPTKEAIIVYNNVSYIFRGYSYEEVEGDWVAYYRFYDFELQYDNGYWKQKNLVLSTNPIFCGTGYDIPFLFGTGIDTTNGIISVDTSVVATQTDLSNKQDTLTQGNGINIDQNNEISVDTSVVATQTDLADKQDKLTAGTNISIVDSTESHPDTQGPCPDGWHIPTLSDFLPFVMVSVNPALPNFTFQDDLGGTYSAYWIATSCQTGSNGLMAINADRFTINPTVNVSFSSPGYIRPVKNTPVQPDSSWTVVYGSLGSNGIFYNATLGLYTAVNNGTTVTISDKNLGATAVWGGSSDPLTQANCGNTYQRGNNQAFPYDGPASKVTLTAPIDISNYGPGNYYSGPFAIYNSNPYLEYFDASQYSIAENLWGGTSAGTWTSPVHIISNTAPEPSVISGDSGATYTIKVSNTAPSVGTPDTTLTFVY